MKKSLLIAVILGVITSFFVLSYLVSIEAKYKQSAEKVPVLVAKRYIDQGKILTQDFVEEKMVPKQYLQPRALQALRDMYNNKNESVFMSILPIEKGEQLLATKLLILGRETGLAAVTPVNMRAITLTGVNESINVIRPGNKIDIIGVFGYEDKNGIPQNISITLMQNILVLGIGDSVLGGMKEAAKAKGSFMGDNSEQAKTISLSVSSQQAEKIALAQQECSLLFVLRPLGNNQEEYKTKGIKIEDVTKGLIPGIRGKKHDQSGDKYLQALKKQQAEALRLFKKYEKK